MTYEAFFNLDDAPFRLTPDPEYYFPSKQHSEALETLLYCVETGEGFVQITGKPGVGKTLLIRSFLDQLGDDVNTALILHPRLEAEELFKVILEDLGLDHESTDEMSKESLLRSFRDILLESAKKGIRTVVIIDEAQEIPEKTLEELRLLSNLETEKTKLLQIILVGQSELEEKLNQESLKQLHQRITNRYRLDTLTLDETINYIQHRLKVAGGGNISRFSLDIIKQIHGLSNGIPRIVNTICERALMAAYVDGKSTVSKEHLDNAVQSLDYNNINDSASNRNKKKQIFSFLLSGLLLAGLALYFTNAPVKKVVDLKAGQLVAFLKTLKIDSTVPPTEDTGEITATASVTKENAQAEQEKQVSANTEYEKNTPKAIDLKEKETSELPEKAKKEQKTAPKPGGTPLKNTPREAPAQQKQLQNTGQVEGEDPEAQNTSESSQEYEYALISPSDAPAPTEQTVREDTPPVAEKKTPFAGNCTLLAPGWSSITILQKKAVQVFQNETVPVKERSLPTGTALGNGMYLLGKEKDTPFLFNHRSFFSWQEDPFVAAWLWEQFSGEKKYAPVIPVVVLPEDTGRQSVKEELSTLRETVKNWAAAFDRKDIEKLMSFYDDSLLNYRLFRNSPTVKSHAEIMAKKTKIFEKNKAVSLQISEPTCIISSEDPSQAMALFYQRFISSSYRDTGIKVLYLRKIKPSIVGSPSWVITGRLWLPGDDNKKKAAD